MSRARIVWLELLTAAVYIVTVIWPPTGIALSAVLRQCARAAGFDHHLVKPVDLDILEKLLQR